MDHLYPKPPFWATLRAVLAKEWRRAGRSRLGRFGPGVVVMLSGLLAVFFTLVIGESDKASVSPAEILQNRGNSSDFSVALALMTATVLPLVGAMQVADLIHHERLSGALQTLRLTPLSPLQVVLGKMLTALGQVLLMFVVLAPVFWLMQTLLALPHWLLLLTLAWALWWGLAATGLVSAATAASNAMMGRGVAAVIMTVLAPPVILALVQGGAWWATPLASGGGWMALITFASLWCFALGLVSGARRLFHPSATPLSVGQALGFWGLLWLALAVLVLGPALTNQNGPEEVLLFFSVALGMAGAWGLLSLTLHGRGGLKLDWPTLDGRFASKAPALLLAAVVLGAGFGLAVLGHLVAGQPVDNLWRVAGLGVAVCLFWLGGVAWVGMALFRLRKIAAAILLWLIAPLLALLLMFWAMPDGPGNAVHPRVALAIPYVHLVAMTEWDSGYNGDTSDIMEKLGVITTLPQPGQQTAPGGAPTLPPSAAVQLAQPRTLTPFGAKTTGLGTGLLLLGGLLFAFLPLPRPRHAYLPKDTKVGLRA